MGMGMGRPSPTTCRPMSTLPTNGRSTTSTRSPTVLPWSTPGRPWLTAHRPSSIMVDHCRPELVMGDHGRPWSTSVDHRLTTGRQLVTMTILLLSMVGHGRAWSTMVDHGRLRFDHGRPCVDYCRAWSSMVSAMGRPWSARVDYYGRRQVDHGRPWVDRCRPWSPMVMSRGVYTMLGHERQ